MNSTLPLLPKDGEVDPTLFSVDWSMLIEGLALIIILSFFVERALALLFESRKFLAYELARAEIGKGSYKPVIAFIASAALCYVWQFDIISVLFHREHMTGLGAIVTGAVIAGGSKASIKLFHDVLDVRSDFFKESREQKSAADNKEKTANAEGKKAGEEAPKQPDPRRL